MQRRLRASCILLCIVLGTTVQSTHAINLGFLTKWFSTPSTAPKQQQPDDRHHTERTIKWAESVDKQQQRVSETQGMSELISILQNPVQTTEDVEVALEALRLLDILVEPIDNANDLHAMNGIAPLVSFLSSHDTSLAAASARVLATAASNNPKFQSDLLSSHAGVIERLTSLIHLDTGVPTTSNAALAALGNILRTTTEYGVEARRSFKQQEGSTVLVDVIHRAAEHHERLGGTLRKKALSLATDLLDLEPAVMDVKSLAVAVVNVLLDTDIDLDTREKALLAVDALMKDPEGAKALKESPAGAAIYSLAVQMKAKDDQGGGKGYIEEVMRLAGGVGVQLEDSEDIKTEL